MKILLISDIHANIWALRTVLKEEKNNFDMICCAGDYTDYGIAPTEVIDCLSNNICEYTYYVKGNHDKHVINTWTGRDFNYLTNGLYKWVHYNCEKLDKKHILWLDSLPDHLVFKADGYNYCIQHQFDEKYGMPESRNAFNVFWEKQTGEKYISESPRRLIFGHTHRQMHCELGDGMEWLNPGSISYRRPDDPDKTANYMIIDNGDVIEKHIPYDRSFLYQEAIRLKKDNRMMSTEIQDFMFFFGSAKTSRDPL